MSLRSYIPGHLVTNPEPFKESIPKSSKPKEDLPSNKKKEQEGKKIKSEDEVNRMNPKGKASGKDRK